MDFTVLLFSQYNTIRRLLKQEYMGENNNDDSHNNSSHFECTVEEEMVKVMNRINSGEANVYERSSSVLQKFTPSKTIISVKNSRNCCFITLLRIAQICL